MCSQLSLLWPARWHLHVRPVRAEQETKAFAVPHLPAAGGQLF